MTSPDTQDLTGKAIGRKKFLLTTGAAAGAATLFGSAPKAYANDTDYAYWDAAQIFSADQHFTGQVYFGSGQPWVDVKAFGAVGNGSSVTRPPHDDTTAIQNAINAAVSAVSEEPTFNNPIIYFPPGDYLISSTLNIPNNGSNFCLMGAGYESSRIIWGGTATGQTMLLLQNAWQVHIKDMGFTVSTTITGVNAPQYGIQVYREAGSTAPSPSLLLVERVFIGSTTGPSPVINTAIVFNADSLPDDGSNDQATFRDVSIQYVNTGYHFAMENALIHTIIGGSVQNCSIAAIDNTPISPSTLGGGYTVFGTRFAGNALTFLIGDTAGDDSIDIIGIRAGTSANPEAALLATSAMSGFQVVSFIGGGAILQDPGAGYSVSFDNPQGFLEFHGFRMASPTGVALNFPGIGAVNFYGGKLYTKTCQYSGPLHFYGTAESNPTPTFTSSGTTSAGLVQFGYNNHMAGTNALTPNVSRGSALGSTVTVSATGANLGGTLTIVIPPGAASGSGELVELYFHGNPPTNANPSMPSAARVTMLLTAASTAAAGVMNLVYGGTVSATPAGYTMYVSTSAGLPVPATQTPPLPPNVYTWNYMLLG